MLVTDCLRKTECNFRVQFVVMARVQEGCGVEELATQGEEQLCTQAALFYLNTIGVCPNIRLTQWTDLLRI